MVVRHLVLAGLCASAAWAQAGVVDSTSVPAGPRPAWSFGATAMPAAIDPVQPLVMSGPGVRVRGPRTAATATGAASRPRRCSPAMARAQPRSRRRRKWRQRPPRRKRATLLRPARCLPRVPPIPRHWAMVASPAVRRHRHRSPIPCQAITDTMIRTRSLLWHRQRRKFWTSSWHCPLKSLPTWWLRPPSPRRFPNLPLACCCWPGCSGLAH
jgi:hypothetical protein